MKDQTKLQRNFTLNSIIGFTSIQQSRSTAGRNVRTHSRSWQHGPYLLCYAQTKFKKSTVKKSRALNETPPQSYGVSLATWDHTVLPSTQHKW